MSVVSNRGGRSHHHWQKSRKPEAALR
ncbi:DUF2554 family protein [Klebsiella sp. WP8-S18-ESBL-06]